MAWGEYPPEYNPKVHGPYDPARWYGKPDTKFSQVKLGELGSWFGRRNKSPQAFIAAWSRGYWGWLHRYVHPQRSGVAPYFQMTALMMTFFYVINYGKMKHHRFYKYH